MVGIWSNSSGGIGLIIMIVADTPTKFNMFASDKWWDWKTTFLLGFGNFLGASC